MSGAQLPVTSAVSGLLGELALIAEPPPPHQPPTSATLLRQLDGLFRPDYGSISNAAAGDDMHKLFHDLLHRTNMVDVAALEADGGALPSKRRARALLAVPALFRALAHASIALAEQLPSPGFDVECTAASNQLLSQVVQSKTWDAAKSLWTSWSVVSAQSESEANVPLLDAGVAALFNAWVSTASTSGLSPALGYSTEDSMTPAAQWVESWEAAATAATSPDDDGVSSSLLPLRPTIVTALLLADSPSLKPSWSLVELELTQALSWSADDASRSKEDGNGTLADLCLRSQTSPQAIASSLTRAVAIVRRLVVAVRRAVRAAAVDRIVRDLEARQASARDADTVASTSDSYPHGRTLASPSLTMGPLALLLNKLPLDGGQNEDSMLEAKRAAAAVKLTTAAHARLAALISAETKCIGADDGDAASHQHQQQQQVFSSHETAHAASVDGVPLSSGRLVRSENDKRRRINIDTNYFDPENSPMRGQDNGVVSSPSAVRHYPGSGNEADDDETEVLRKQAMRLLHSDDDEAATDADDEEQQIAALSSLGWGFGFNNPAAAASLGATTEGSDGRGVLAKQQPPASAAARTLEDFALRVDAQGHAVDPLFAPAFALALCRVYAKATVGSNSLSTTNGSNLPSAQSSSTALMPFRLALVICENFVVTARAHSGAASSSAGDHTHTDPGGHSHQPTTIAAATAAGNDVSSGVPIRADNDEDDSPAPNSGLDKKQPALSFDADFPLVLRMARAALQCVEGLQRDLIQSESLQGAYAEDWSRALFSVTRLNRPSPATAADDDDTSMMLDSRPHYSAPLSASATASAAALESEVDSGSLQEMVGGALAAVRGLRSELSRRQHQQQTSGVRTSQMASAGAAAGVVAPWLQLPPAPSQSNGGARHHSGRAVNRGSAYERDDRSRMERGDGTAEGNDDDDGEEGVDLGARSVSARTPSQREEFLSESRRLHAHGGDTTPFSPQSVRSPQLSSRFPSDLATTTASNTAHALQLQLAKAAAAARSSGGAAAGYDADESFRGDDGGSATLITRTGTPHRHKLKLSPSRQSVGAHQTPHGAEFVSLGDGGPGLRFAGWTLEAEQLLSILPRVAFPLPLLSVTSALHPRLVWGDVQGAEQQGDEVRVSLGFSSWPEAFNSWLSSRLAYLPAAHDPDALRVSSVEGVLRETRELRATAADLAALLSRQKQR